MKTNIPALTTNVYQYLQNAMTKMIAEITVTRIQIVQEVLFITIFIYLFYFYFYLIYMKKVDFYFPLT